MKVVILHGTKGSPEGNRFPRLKKELEKQGHEAYVPTFPTPQGQSVKNWCKALDEQAPRFDGDTILIGHSCGATYLLHILEVLSIPVAQSVFVSGFIDEIGNPEYDILNESFVHHTFNWEKILKNTGNISLFHGDNDPYVPLPLAQRLAEHLKTPLTIIPNGGHLNSESGYTEFSELLQVLNIGK